MNAEVTTRRRLARASEGVRASEGSEGVRVVAVRVRVRVRSRARARARIGRHAWSSPLRKMAHGGHVRHAGPVQELAPLLAPDGHEGLGHDDQHPACLRSRRAWRGVGRGGEGGGVSRKPSRGGCKMRTGVTSGERRAVRCGCARLKAGPRHLCACKRQWMRTSVYTVLPIPMPSAKMPPR